MRHESLDGIKKLFFGFRGPQEQDSFPFHTSLSVNEISKVLQRLRCSYPGTEHIH